MCALTKKVLPAKTMKKKSRYKYEEKPCEDGRKNTGLKCRDSQLQGGRVNSPGGPSPFTGRLGNGQIIKVCLTCFSSSGFLNVAQCPAVSWPRVSVDLENASLAHHYSQTLPSKEGPPSQRHTAQASSLPSRASPPVTANLRMPGDRMLLSK